jgi:hypothetical protein
MLKVCPIEEAHVKFKLIYHKLLHNPKVNIFVGVCSKSFSIL